MLDGDVSEDEAMARLHRGLGSKKNAIQEANSSGTDDEDFRKIRDELIEADTDDERLAKLTAIEQVRQEEESLHETITRNPLEYWERMNV